MNVNGEDILSAGRWVALNDANEAVESDAAGESNDEETYNSSDGEGSDHEEEEVAVNPALPIGGGIRMRLSDAERQWAIAIKEAISQDPDLDSLSDFEITQFALVQQDDMEAVLERVHKMQAFKQEYSTVDNLGSAKRVLQRCMDLFPGLFLSLSYSQPLERYIVAIDMTKFFKNRVDNDENALKAWMNFGYYMFHSMNPDFESVRQGVILLVECGGFCWHRNVNLELFKMFWLDFVSAYPIKMKKIRHFHTSLFFNLLASMVKPCIPSDIKPVFEIGCVSLFGRLDQVYLTPNVETANKKFMARFEGSLQVRYQNASGFSL
ncbi:expressed unknown protein [Seminavis robusta]|uniref:CRAL-TRIO domain-containing protein n=1 Tax=Seminavis robusta TaxID=568900 RepID=A0A9N8E7A4_9STRA|nr:expressed unknown protein [Seminavis robusta]|eukprot:Sro697_g189130.1 n/a (322) ;mRNA; r:47315-48280